jgi:hypothetical protein
MPERSRMCIVVDGKFVGHLIRKISHHQETEHSEISVERLQKSKMEICIIETSHVGTITTLTAQPGILHTDMKNPVIFWVELSYILQDEPESPHRRKPSRIGMMLFNEESSMIHIIHFMFRAEVHAANGWVLEGAAILQKRWIPMYRKKIANKGTF